MVEAVTTTAAPRQAFLMGVPWVVGRRVVQAIPALLVLSVACFVLVSATPGDPLTSRMDRQAVVIMTPAQRAHALHVLGLDQPLPVQYFGWLGRALTGDFGYSIQTGQPAWSMVSSRISASLILLAGALVVVIGFGLAAGVTAARFQGRAIDRIMSGAIVLLIAIPPYVIGLVAILLVAVHWGVLPTGGMRVAGEPLTLSILSQHLLLPALVLGMANAAPLARYTRSAMIEVLAADHIRTARSTGSSESAVLRRHVYRNAALPAITIIASLVPDLLAAAVITEQVFGWPGVGSLAVSSAESSDGPVLMLIVLIVGLTTITMNLLADLLYAIIDPRVEVS
jgi:peptide/nickel transport system permease protein